MTKHRSRRRLIYPPLIFLIVALAAYGLISCTFGFDPNQPGSGGNTGGDSPQGETAQVVTVVDGDTIDVRLASGQVLPVRYIGINTPERDEVCYREAREANRLLVQGQTVTLVSDAEDRDRYDRLLRYVYVGSLDVNRALVEQGFAEAVLYPPNDAHYDEYLSLERQARAANRGCHPTGIFNDGSDTR